jgi:hypothetical protein
MKKIIFMLMIIMIASFSFANNEIPPVTGEILMDNIDLITKDIEGKELPNFLTFIIKNEKINGYITLNNGEIATLNVIIEDGVITKLEEGESEESTLEVRTNEKTITKIISSENPGLELKKAMDDGNINYKAIGITNQIKVGVLNIVYKIFNWFTSEEDQYQETEFSSKYASVEYLNQEKEYINNIQDNQQKEILLDTLNYQKEIALGNVEGERINEQGQILKEVQLKDGSQEFVMLNYDDLKREYEMQERYAGEQWSEITELISNIKSGEITMDAVGIQDTNAFREFQDWNDEITVEGAGTATIADNNKNIYVIGSIKAKYEEYPYGGLTDGIIISYNKFGEKKWVKTFGGDSYDHFSDVALDSEGNIIVFAEIGPGIESLNGGYGDYIIKYNQFGELLSAKNIDLGNKLSDKMFIDSGDNLYFTKTKKNEYYKDLLFIKLNKNLEQQWIKEISTHTNSPYVNGATFDIEGNIYFFGYAIGFDEYTTRSVNIPFIIKFDKDGNKIWSKKIYHDEWGGAQDLKISNDSIYVVGNNGKDQFIAKLSLTGELIQDKHLYSPDEYNSKTRLFKSNNQLFVIAQDELGKYKLFRVLEDGSISEENIELDQTDFSLMDSMYLDSVVYNVGTKEIIERENYRLKVSTQKLDLSMFDVNFQFKYNDEFNKEDFSQQGLMHYADQLYEEGVLPFWPHLTSIKSQGERGTGEEFTFTAGTELVLMNHLDLSEQQVAYYYGMQLWPQHEGIPITLEEGWPYNPEECNAEEGELGYYVTEDAEIIPCTRTDHQGISVDNPINVGDFSEHEQLCDQYYINDDLTPCRLYYPYAETINSESKGCVLIDSFLPLSELTGEEKLQLIKNVLLDLKYPLYFVDKAVGPGCGTIDQNGFEEVCNPNGYLGGHAMLIVGYISKEYLPDLLKNDSQGNFDSNQDYLIVKNSWGKSFGDGGFFYVSAESVINEKIFSLQPFKYDVNNEVYSGCDSTRSAGII